jgi:DNA invertase Pin-like site-specific DNA recombinase
LILKNYSKTKATTTARNNAVVYARYSSSSQQEQSIDGQIRVITEFAQKQGYRIIGTYIDRAMTGRNDDRPDFQRMIADSFNHEFDYVIVYKLDRFSRSRYDSAVHKRTLRNNGVKVLSATESIADTPEGIMFESIIEGYNEYYSAELSVKIRRGLKESRLKGNFTGGKVMYGYDIAGKKWVVNERETEIVRKIFTDCS